MNGYKFDDARRVISWPGGFRSFNNRNDLRYRFLALLWDRVGEYITAEEIAHALFDKSSWRWSSIRRYGNRVQQLELAPSNCPYFIRQEAEGFTLLPLS